MGAGLGLGLEGGLGAGSVMGAGGGLTGGAGRWQAVRLGWEAGGPQFKLYKILKILKIFKICHWAANQILGILKNLRAFKFYKILNFNWAAN